MKFAKKLARYTAREIADALDCPIATAYKWKEGKRVPPDWQQPLFLKAIKEHKDALKGNASAKNSDSEKKKQPQK